MSELENQAQDELNAMMSGTNDTETTETEEEVETDEVETETEEEVDSSEEDLETENKSKKEKTENRFKKVLSDKNSFKTKAEEALAKVNELENKLADKDFYGDRPQAKKFVDEISSIREANPNLSREDAFNMIAGRENLSSKPKGLLGKPKGPEAKKTTTDMSVAELEVEFEKSGGLGAML